MPSQVRLIVFHVSAHVFHLVAFVCRSCGKWSVVIAVLVMGLVMVVIVGVTLGIWEERPKRSCADLLEEEEYAPYVFDALSSERVAFNREGLNMLAMFLQ